MKLFSKILCIGLCAISSMSFVGAMETPAEVTGLKRSLEAAGLSSASLATELDGAPVRKVPAILVAEASTPSSPNSPLLQIFWEKTRSCQLPNRKIDASKFVDVLVSVLQRWYTSTESLPSDCVVISLRDFMSQLLFKPAWRGKDDISLFVAIQALFYIKEILSKPLVLARYHFAPRNVRCLFFTAFIIAYDFLEDDALRIKSRHWAHLLKLVCGKQVYSVEKIKEMKAEFLHLLDWNLHVSPEKMMEFLTEIFEEDHSEAVGAPRVSPVE